jgi:hypothetical protein
LSDSRHRILIRPSLRLRDARSSRGLPFARFIFFYEVSPQILSVKKVLHSNYFLGSDFPAGVVIPDPVVWVYFLAIQHLAIPFHYDRQLGEFPRIALFYLGHPEPLVSLALRDGWCVLDLPSKWNCKNQPTK